MKRLGIKKPLTVASIAGIFLGVGADRVYLHFKYKKPEIFAQPSLADIARNDAFANCPGKSSCELLLAGDSLIDFWRDYPDIWRKYFNDIHALNFGIGGDTTGNLMWRLNGATFDGMHPRVVIVMIGTNNLASEDWSQLTDEIESDAQAFRKKLHARVLVVGLFPCGRTVDSPANRPEIIRKCNAELAALNGPDFLDVSEQLRGTDGRLRPDLTTDGIHLTAAGYEIFGNAITLAAEPASTSAPLHQQK